MLTVAEIVDIRRIARFRTLYIPESIILYYGSNHTITTIMRQIYQLIPHLERTNFRSNGSINLRVRVFRRRQQIIEHTLHNALHGTYTGEIFHQ